MTRSIARRIAYVVVLLAVAAVPANLRAGGECGCEAAQLVCCGTCTRR